MFELLLEKIPSQSGENSKSEPDIKPDLEQIDKLLKEFLDSHGQSQKEYESFPSVYRNNLAKIIDKLGCSPSVQADIEARMQTFQGRINKINEQLAIQDEAIAESKKLIENAMVEYTKAVVEGSSDLIEQLEANKDKLEKNIKQINQRKAILNAELLPLENKRSRAERMAREVELKIKRILYRKEFENYKSHLKDFSKYINEFCEKLFNTPGAHTREEIIRDIMKELNGTGWSGLQ